MDFKDSIKRLAENFESLKDKILTEEATKTSLILPFINALGYDIFNPREVLPEMCCDIGTKKGEKIDYAILQDDEPIILIECKHWQQNLSLHENQLLRYFGVSKAKFGVLTNGLTYKFYTDLAVPNLMDEKPFLEINILDIKDEQIEELKKFHRSKFDVDSIMSTASELKYMGELKTVISKEFSNPSPEFIKFFGKQVYEGQFTQKMTEQFYTLVKRTINNYVNYIISDRLKAAIDNSVEPTNLPTDKDTDNSVEDQPSEPKIITTEQELEAFYIVKSILRNTIDSKRINYRDSQSYFSVLIDNNNRKLVCRLYFNSETNKRISFVDENRDLHHNKISTIDDIYQFTDDIIAAASKFI